MGNLSLGIGILAQIGVLIWSTSINHAQSYTQLSLYVGACVKCILKLCMVMYNYALVCKQQKKFDHKIICCKKLSLDTPRDRNILPQTTFTWKYPTMNLSQITVLHFNCTCLGIMILEGNVQQPCSFLCTFLFTEMYVKWSVINAYQFS